MDLIKFDKENIFLVICLDSINNCVTCILKLIPRMLYQKDIGKQMTFYLRQLLNKLILESHVILYMF